MDDSKNLTFREVLPNNELFAAFGNKKLQDDDSNGHKMLPFQVIYIFEEILSPT